MSDNFFKIYKGASISPSDVDPTNPTEGDIFFASDTHATRSEGNYEYSGGDWVKLASGGTQITRNQTTHGFALLEPIYHNGTIWVLAQADDEETLAEYVITRIIDADNFVASKFGAVTLTAHGQTIGEHYFLDDAVVGTAEITDDNLFSCPLYYVEDVDTIHVEVYRPSEQPPEITPVSWEKKTIAGVTGGTAIIPSLGFSGLTIGKSYRITGNVDLSENNVTNSAAGGMNILHDSVIIFRSRVFSTSGTGTSTQTVTAISTIFTATTTTLETFAANGNTGTINPSTFLILEEMPTKKISTEPNTLWQRKTLVTPQGAAVASIAELNFNNLVIGETYRISGNAFFNSAGASNRMEFNYDMGAFRVTSVSCVDNPAGSAEMRIGYCGVFVATATSLIANTLNSTSGTLSATETHAVLEHLPEHQTTTAWT